MVKTFCLQCNRGLVLKASRDERQLSLEFLKLQRAEAVVGPLRTPRLPGFELTLNGSNSFLRIFQHSSLITRVCVLAKFHVNVDSPSSRLSW